MYSARKLICKAWLVLEKKQYKCKSVKYRSTATLKVSPFSSLPNWGSRWTFFADFISCGSWTECSISQRWQITGDDDAKLAQQHRRLRLGVKEPEHQRFTLWSRTGGGRRSSARLRADSSHRSKQRGHGWVNRRTHSYTLAHNLLVTRAGFHDNRQAEGEMKKKERERNPAPLSQNMKSHVRMMYYQMHETKK